MLWLNNVITYISCNVDPSCLADVFNPAKLTNGTTSSEGLIEICSNKYRFGLCYDELVADPEAAIVLCRQVDIEVSNPGK